VAEPLAEDFRERLFLAINRIVYKESSHAGRFRPPPTPENSPVSSAAIQQTWGGFPKELDFETLSKIALIAAATRICPINKKDIRDSKRLGEPL